MSNCKEIKDLFPDYINEKCSKDVREKIEKHLCECKECNILLEELKDVPEEEIYITDLVALDPLKKIKKRSKRTVLLVSFASLTVILVMLTIFYFWSKSTYEVIAYCEKTPITVFETILELFSDKYDPDDLRILLREKETSGTLNTLLGWDEEIEIADKDNRVHRIILNISERSGKVVLKMYKKTGYDTSNGIKITTILDAIEENPNLMEFNNNKCFLILSKHDVLIPYMIVSNTNYYYDINKAEYTDYEKILSDYKGGFNAYYLYLCIPSEENTEISGDGIREVHKKSITFVEAE